MRKLISYLDRQMGFGGTLPSALKILAVVALVAFLAFYFRDRLVIEAQVTPCSPSGYPGRCYFVKEKVCEMALRQAEESCKEFVLKQNLPPGRLTGPTIMACQMVTYDNAFHLSRKQEAECDQKVKELQDWKRMNMGGI